MINRNHMNYQKLNGLHSSLKTPINQVIFCIPNLRGRHIFASGLPIRLLFPSFLTTEWLHYFAKSVPAEFLNVFLFSQKYFCLRWRCVFCLVRTFLSWPCEKWEALILGRKKNFKKILSSIPWKQTQFSSFRQQQHHCVCNSKIFFLDAKIFIFLCLTLN